MMKPEFGVMTRKELLAYVRIHPNDDEAFYAYMERVNSEPRGAVHPAPKSLDDLKNFPELLSKFQQERENQKRS